MADAYKLIDYDALAAYHQKNKAALDDINEKIRIIRNDLTRLDNKYVMVTQEEAEGLWDN